METAMIEVRNLTMEDYQALKESMQQAYASLGGQYWKEDALKKLMHKFPDGQVVITHNGKVVGCALSIIVNYDRFGDRHNYRDITGNFSFDTHDEKGDTLYGIEVFVHPGFRGMRLARRLYDARKTLCERLNLKMIVAGGRIPKYGMYADQFTPRMYIDKVRNREIFDPTLTFQLSNDFQVKKFSKIIYRKMKKAKDMQHCWFGIMYFMNRRNASLCKRKILFALVLCNGRCGPILKWKSC